MKITEVLKKGQYFLVEGEEIQRSSQITVRYVRGQLKWKKGKKHSEVVKGLKIQLLVSQQDVREIGQELLKLGYTKDDMMVNKNGMEISLTRLSKLDARGLKKVDKDEAAIIERAVGKLKILSLLKKPNVTINEVFYSLAKIFDCMSAQQIDEGWKPFSFGEGRIAQEIVDIFIAILNQHGKKIGEHYQYSSEQPGILIVSAREMRSCVAQYKQFLEDQKVEEKEEDAKKIAAQTAAQPKEAKDSEEDDARFKTALTHQITTIKRKFSQYRTVQYDILKFLLNKLPDDTFEHQIKRTIILQLMCIIKMREMLVVKGSELYLKFPSLLNTRMFSSFIQSEDRMVKEFRSLYLYIPEEAFLSSFFIDVASQYKQFKEFNDIQNALRRLLPELSDFEITRLEKEITTLKQLSLDHLQQYLELNEHVTQAQANQKCSSDQVQVWQREVTETLLRKIALAPLFKEDLYLYRVMRIEHEIMEKSLSQPGISLQVTLQMIHTIEQRNTPVGFAKHPSVLELSESFEMLEPKKGFVDEIKVRAALQRLQADVSIETLTSSWPLQEVICLISLLIQAKDMVGLKKVLLAKGWQMLEKTINSYQVENVQEDQWAHLFRWLIKEKRIDLIKQIINNKKHRCTTHDLFMACLYGQEAIVNYFLKVGRFDRAINDLITVKDKKVGDYQSNAFLIACEKGFANIIQALMRLGYVEPTIRNSQGISAIDLIQKSPLPLPEQANLIALLKPKKSEGTSNSSQMDTTELSSEDKLSETTSSSSNTRTKAESVSKNETQSNKDPRPAEDKVLEAERAKVSSYFKSAINNEVIAADEALIQEIESLFLETLDEDYEMHGQYTRLLQNIAKTKFDFSLLKDGFERQKKEANLCIVAFTSGKSNVPVSHFNDLRKRHIACVAQFEKIKLQLENLRTKLTENVDRFKIIKQRTLQPSIATTLSTESTRSLSRASIDVAVDKEEKYRPVTSSSDTFFQAAQYAPPKQHRLLEWVRQEEFCGKIIETLKECCGFSQPMDDKNQTMLLKIQCNTILYFIYKFIERQLLLTPTYQLIFHETLKKLEFALIYRKGLFDEMQTIETLKAVHAEIVSFGKLWIQCVNEKKFKNLDSDPFYQKLISHGTHFKQSKEQEVSDSDQVIYTLATQSQKVFCQNCPYPIPVKMIIGAERMMGIVSNIYSLDFSERIEIAESTIEKTIQNSVASPSFS